MSRSELLPIQDIGQFSYILTQWHKSKVNVIEHMLTVPAGTAVETVEGETLVLEGDLLKGVRIGLTVALSELGVLPFTTFEEDNQQEESSPTDEPITT